jgi:hypothetical protein
MLISLGATSYFLRLRHPEASERFKRLARMSETSSSVDMAFGIRSRGRRNEPKHIGRTTLLPVHLPRGLYELVSTYSSATGTSRNALLSRFLEAGYLIYMKGQNSLLETIRSLQEERQASRDKTSQSERSRKAALHMKAKGVLNSDFGAAAGTRTASGDFLGLDE